MSNKKKEKKQRKAKVKKPPKNDGGRTATLVISLNPDKRKDKRKKAKLAKQRECIAKKVTND